MKQTLEQFFHTLDRSYFMEELKELANIDSAFPIGYGQTISQPSLVYLMTELLTLDKVHTVLEIGTGSGYQTAFLAEFSGTVYTIERISALYDTAKLRLAALGYTNIIYTFGDGSCGLPAYAPYDRIIVTAAARAVPPAYIDQLKPNGRLVIPVGDAFGQDLLVIEKDLDGRLTEQIIEKVRFVPLVGEYEI